MSQPAPNPHTQRSVAGMVGSMIVVVVAVVGWVGFRSFVSDPPSPPPRVVDWTVAAGFGDRADALALFAPNTLPLGWSAKDATYQGGSFPEWYVAFRTADVKTVSITEAMAPGRTLVAEIDKDATQGEDVTLDGVVWQTWKFSKGDYGISREAKAPTGGSESVLVHGSGSSTQIHDFAESLQPRNAEPAS